MSRPDDRATRRPAPAVAWRAHLPTAALVLLGLVLYARGMLLGFVGDDYTLLDAALRHPLGELLTGRHGILGYYRPISRELYFWWWGRVLELGPGGFHVVNALTYAAVIVMIERLGTAWAGPRAGWIAAAAFVVFPPGSALMSWVSCAQDLIMLFWALGAMLLMERGRHGLAGVATALAMLSKETAVVLPAALAVMDGLRHHGTPIRARVLRLAPCLLGFAAAVGIALAARATWPAGAAITVWSPAQFTQAWRLPIDFLRALFPPDAGAGISQALTGQFIWVVLAALAAALAVPPLSAEPRGGAGARGAAGRAERFAEPPGGRALVVFGLALALLAMLPVGFVSERWRSYFFSLSGLGAGLAAAVPLARWPDGVARLILALAAVVNFGAGGIYRPVESAEGPARHPHVNYAFFRDTGALSTRLLQALAPWCDSLRALPRTFAAGIPPDEVFENAFGPGLRVTCRDTVSRVRFLSDFTPADAATEFGVLRFDASSGRFVHERADARVRARVGEGFLIHTRFDVAAACFGSIAGTGTDRELSYPTAVALAAAGREGDARARWAEAVRRGAVLDPATMASRLSAPSGSAAGTGAAAGGTPADLSPLAAAVLRAPWEAAPHRTLGRALLERGRAREAAFELAAAAGIGRGNDDLARLAPAYEAMGLTEEAVAAYRRALDAGLAEPLYSETRERFMALMRTARTELDRSRTQP